MADEAVQEVFIIMWEKRNKLEIKKNLRAYLLAAVKNYFLNYIKENKRFVILDETQNEILVWEDFIEDELNNYESYLSKLIHLVNKLPKTQQMVFNLNRLRGMSSEEISLRLNISKRTVEHHLYLATKKIRSIGL